MLHFAQVTFLGGSILLGFYVAGFRVILRGGGLGPAQSQDCADLWPGRPARIRLSIRFFPLRRTCHKYCFTSRLVFS